MDNQAYLSSHLTHEELDIPEYTSHKLKLVTPSTNYAQESLDWVSDKEVGQYMGADFSNVSLEAEEQRLKEIIEDTNSFNWIIECDGKAIGNINISNIAQISQEFGVKSGKLNYLIGDKKLWGQGITTAVARKVLDWAFTKGEFLVIKSRVLIQNKSSQAVLKKLGFKEYGKEDYDGPDIGQPTEYIIYKFTKEEWINFK